VLKCNDNGDGQMPVETCDGVQGVVCDPNRASAPAPAPPSRSALSYIGCDYYPTVTQQHDSYNGSPKHNFAVAVANTSDKEAKVTSPAGQHGRPAGPSAPTRSSSSRCRGSTS
jgi:hypothetical protein